MNKNMPQLWEDGFDRFWEKALHELPEGYDVQITQAVKEAVRRGYMQGRFDEFDFRMFGVSDPKQEE